MVDAFVDGLVVPAPTLLCGDAGVSASVPPPTMSSGDVGASLSVPPVTLTSQAEWDITALSAPPPTLSSSGNEGAALDIPAPTINTGGDPGSYNVINEAVPAPGIAVEALISSLLVVQQEVPAVLLDAYGLLNEIVSVELSILAPLMNASALVGADASALLTIVAPIMDAAGYSTYSISVSVQVPPPQLTAFMGSPIATNFRSWVLNTRKGALTEYDNFNFNSYAYFNGQVLACGSSGVVVLGTQADDNGVAITALGRTGKSDYDHSWLKRVPRLYLKHKADGDLLFRTITAESGTRTYLLPTNHTVGFQQRRIPIGKGPKAAFWQYEFENVEGADFTIQGILVYPINLRRRIM